jgi:hypothetical protein
VWQIQAVISAAVQAVGDTGRVIVGVGRDLCGAETGRLFTLFVRFDTMTLQAECLQIGDAVVASAKQCQLVINLKGPMQFGVALVAFPLLLACNFHALCGAQLLSFRPFHLTVRLFFQNGHVGSKFIRVQSYITTMLYTATSIRGVHV